MKAEDTIGKYLVMKSVVVKILKAEVHHKQPDILIMTEYGIVVGDNKGKIVKNWTVLSGEWWDNMYDDFNIAILNIDKNRGKGSMIPVDWDYWQTTEEFIREQIKSRK